MRSQIAASAVVVAALVAAQPALAQADQSPASETPEIVAKLFECREIVDPDERLACFDREVSAVYEAQASEELVIADRQQVEKTRRGLFGLRIPDLGIFGGRDEDTLNQIETVLAGATKLRNGRHILELEDGARWIETEDVAGFRKFKAGDTIVISRGALGSFKAKVDGKRAAKVRRLN